MTELKYRLAACDRLYDQTRGIKQANPTGEWMFAWEQIALHLRKCMELVVFGSLVAHRDAYAAIHPDYAQHWKAHKILDKLAKANPNFFPTPTKITNTAPGAHHLTEPDRPRLTVDDVIFLFDRASDLIHVFQPFQNDGAVTVDLKYTPHEWTQRIWNLLEEHYVMLLGGRQMLLVQMAAPPHGRVKVMRAEPDESASSF